MSTVPDREAAKLSYLAKFTDQEEKQAAEDLLVIIDDQVADRRLKSGGLSQLIHLNSVLEQDEFWQVSKGQISNLPTSLNLMFTRAIIDYLKEGYGIVIQADDEFDWENTDPTILLTEVVVPERAEPAAETEADDEFELSDEEPVFSSSALPDPDFNPGALDMVNAMPLAAPASQASSPARPDAMDHWPHLRDSVNSVFEAIVELDSHLATLKESHGDLVEISQTQMRIKALWDDLDQREWFMQRMSRQRSRFGQLFTRGVRFLHARASGQDLTEFYS